MQQGQTTPLQKLKYRIVYCSGEDNEYPVTELLTQSPQSKGWQSPRFCDYPQEIALQFLSPVRIRQLQVLSHQSKIASKIELFVYLPDPRNPNSEKNVQYKKLGYMSLDPNEKSSYQARELKSVYIDVPALYLKLSFQKCYVNKYNLFNQVAIIALSIFGEVLGGPTPQDIKPKEYFNEIQFETQFDPNTLERLRALEQAKDIAVRNEDFQEAKRLKEAIERLKQIGTQLRQLEERKLIAIQNEDYDSAAIIKSEIDKIRNTIAPESVAPDPMSYGQPYAQYQGFNRQSQPQQPQYNPPSSQYPDSQIPNQQWKSPPTNNQISVEQENRLNNRSEMFHVNQQPIQEEIQEYRQPFNPLKEKLTRKDQIQNHDDQVIPAVTNKPGIYNPNDEEEGNANHDNLVPDRLTREQISLKIPENYISVLTEEFCMRLLSKQWPLREESLKWLETELGRPQSIKHTDQQALNTAVMCAISLGINDKTVQVQQRSMSVLQVLLIKYQQKTPLKGDFLNYVEVVIQGLMERLGETNQRVKEEGEKCLQLMSDSQSIGQAIIFSHLAKGFQKTKLNTSIKHILGRLNFLYTLVEKFQNQSNLDQTIQFAVKNVEHQNGDIRAASIELIVALLQIFGDKIKVHLQSVRPNIMDEIESRLESSNPQQMKQSVPVQQQVTVKGPQQQQQQKKKDDENKKNNQSKVCEFCGKTDKQFIDSNKMDLHLWRECPMLTTCKYCAQVVEISTYTNHQLTECEQQRQFKRCPRCKEAIHTSEYDKHQQDKICPVPKGGNRCPLCHTDIGNDWKNHLVIHGCPNNERAAG